VTRFERALQDHDVPAIAALVADDIVVFERTAAMSCGPCTFWPGCTSLELRAEGWKIVSLDWSIGKHE
jgi:hypothetical protein